MLVPAGKKNQLSESNLEGEIIFYIRQEGSHQAKIKHSN